MNAVAPLRRAWRALDSTKTVYAACAVSLALALCFIFVWSPLPWGWLGIDHYDDRALRLAAGQPFDTTDVPWGYAYYLALFYKLFGHRLWPPLVCQAILNALVPLLLFRLVRPLAGQRTAALAAVLTGVFSFNTLYAATQSSDAICTVLFLVSLLLFARGCRTQSAVAFGSSGAVMGLAVQFRPNLILFPLVASLIVLVLIRPIWPALRAAALHLALFVVMLTPWIVRNYALTNLFLPTSTHGAIQLWYGTLQTGEYLERGADNPRRYFEAPPFDYTSLENLPIPVWAESGDCQGSVLELIYWTNRDPQPVHVEPVNMAGLRRQFELPGQQAPTTIDFYFETTWTDAGGSHREWAPRRGPEQPFVFFVSNEHLRDLDAGHQLLDVFDIAHIAEEDGTAGDDRLRAAVERLTAAAAPGAPARALTGVVRSPDHVRLDLADGSTLTIPTPFSGLITDLDARGDVASRLLYAHVPMETVPAGGPPACRAIGDWGINDSFYRAEPHRMRRYMALALDNIRRDPVAFAAASAYRLIRVFVIRGSGDEANTQQFAASRIIYTAGSVLSACYFAVFIAGAWIAVRRRMAVGWLLVPVAYVPVTICIMLTNMRYSVTIQPYIFVFVAVAIIEFLVRSDALAR